MRAWIFSDLHLDVNKWTFALPRTPDCDVVLIAGDLCERASLALKWLAARKIEVPVVYVPGNHDFYGTKIEDEIVLARTFAKDFGIHFLNGNVFDFTTRGGERARVMGATLWTDYRLAGETWKTPAMLAARIGMSDHVLIRSRARGGAAFLPSDAEQRCAAAVAWLDHMLNVQPFDGTTIVVTHHAPSVRSIHPSYHGKLLNAAYASNLDDLVGKCDLWVHGHVHHRFDYRIGCGRVICNPLGYRRRGEGKSFDPELVVEVGRGS
jgi:predicted phosphodiesterase